jgi:hypothetical protein
VSRLLPERFFIDFSGGLSLGSAKGLSIGLFPGQCWLRQSRAPGTPSLAMGEAMEEGAMLRALESLLTDAGTALAKNASVSLLVSDGLAAITSLPWQEELHTFDELQAYGQACFEQQGMAIDDSWLMHTEFRQHRASGMAYALPRAWLTDVLTLLAASGLRLRRVLPVSAGAYALPPSLPAGRSVVLMREARRTSALVYDGRAFAGIDVEPVTSSSEDSGKRLLRRIGASGGAIEAVWHWAPALPDQGKAPQFIGQCLPDAINHALERDVWN